MSRFASLIGTFHYVKAKQVPFLRVAVKNGSLDVSIYVLLNIS
jgi:hypothetical protein